MPAARLSETCLLVSWSSYTKFRNNLSAEIYLRVIEADHALNLTKSSGGHDMISSRGFGIRALARFGRQGYAELHRPDLELLMQLIAAAASDEV